ncbi:RELT-like protein 2 [Grus japonensis]|uniref:RELT-like protein 2 n=1 Tax=Grus japonensis TaxID=30415 RepID=A0ABC9XEQ5_GRUJA
MCRVGGNAWEEKERFIVQDNVRGHEENGNKLTMTASPRGSAETQSCEVPRLEETRIRMSDQNSTDDGESDPQHSLSMVFLLVLVFFIMGLVGFLICHVLKKKGYRCRTFRDELDPDNKDVLAELQANEEEELNEDTVEKIVRCIIQNEANAEALKEMLGDNEGDIPVPVPRFRVTHIGKKPTFHEQQDGPLPDGSREPSTEELEHSSDRLQRDRARNGTVPTGGLQNGAVQRGAQSGKGGEQSRSTTPAPNTPASSGTRDSRRAGKASGAAGSLQDAGTAPGSTSRQRKLLSHRVLGGSSPSIPGELVQEGASICLEETGLGSADEVSDIHGSLSLHEQADELEREDSSRKQPGAAVTGQQEPSVEVQDRGATV